MKKVIKKILWFLLILVLLIVIYKYFFSEDKTSAGIMEKILVVSSGSIKESIEVVGNVELVDEQSLSFKIAGTITKVNFKAGDEVKKGDIIAEIDNKDALNSIRDAELSLENAKISLQELYKLPDDNKILQAKNTITQSDESLKISQEELENLKISQENAKTKAIQDIENSKKELENSKKSVENSKADLETSKKNLEISKSDLEISKKSQDQSFNNSVSNVNTTIKNAEENLKSYLTEIEGINLNADYILGVSDTNRTKNDSFEIYISAKNPTFKNQAELLLNQSILALNSLKTEANNYNFSGDRDEIVRILQKFSDIYDLVYKMSDSLYNAVENSIEGTALTEVQINNFKNTTSSARSSALSKKTIILSAIQSLNSLTDTELLASQNQNSIASKEESIKSQELAISKTELAISSAELNISKTQNAIENAEKNYQELLASQKIALTNKENEIANKQKTLSLAQTSYNDLIKGPTSENVLKTKNTIEQAELRLDNAKTKLEDYVLEAPFDGIITKIDYMIGDNLKNDTNKYVYLQNPNLVEIIVKLDQVDVVNVEIGDESTIIFDAYPELSLKAKVVLVDATPASNNGVISYKVKLVLEDGVFEKKLFSGMTSSVEMIMKQKDDVLVLIDEALIEENGKYFVNVEKNLIREKVEIQVGLNGGGFSEIVSGLNLGDKVVYEVEEFVLKINENLDNQMKVQEEMERQFQDIRM